jgi:putative DNA primase/helicase
MALKNVSEALELKYDRLIWTAIGKNRNSTSWINKKWMWSEFVNRLQFTQRTGETQSEFNQMTRAEQDNIKDVGGFVGGDCAKGKRKKENILSRCLITLDADDVQESAEDFYNRVLMVGAAHVVYSTHKHKPKAPRLRVIFLLNRNISPDEYQAVARKVAEMLDIEAMDKTTYQINRLMYWPSASRDGEYFFKFEDMPMLDADEILEGYPDWKDHSYWPKSSKEILIERNEKKAEDPREKDGVIGAFCNVYYPIQTAIDTFLSDVYTQGPKEDRYTYVKGSTVNGLRFYDEDVFAFSEHGTDPANNGHLLNAFDLVRIHKFDKGDEKESFKLMAEFAANDPETSLYMQKKKYEEMDEPFIDENPEWRKDLKKDKKGDCLTNAQNLLLIFKNDPKLANFKKDLFTDRIIITGNLPYSKYERDREWHDSDDAKLRMYLEIYYGIKGPNQVKDAFETTLSNRAFHPIRNYIESLPKWDGKNPQIENVFSLYGAPSTELIRAQAKIFFTAAVARVFEPGCRFDYTLVLIGEGGIKKSSLLQLLAKDRWYAAIRGSLDKAAQEKIQGTWLAEIDELEALRKSDMAAVKSFITDRFDRYRNSFGHYAKNHPRQCVFIGTTNERECIQESGGGERRFWAIDVLYEADLDKINVDRFWAEAYHYYRQGIPLFLSKKLEDQAKEIRQAHFERPEGTEEIEEWLNVLLPENWEEMTVQQKWEWYHSDNREPGTKQRNIIRAYEIWTEFYEKNPADFHVDTRPAKSINKAMKSLPGWEFRIMYLKGKTCRVFVRKGTQYAAPL